jgi:hypothetical protein
MSSGGEAKSRLGWVVPIATAIIAAITAVVVAVIQSSGGNPGPGPTPTSEAASLASVHKADTVSVPVGKYYDLDGGAVVVAGDSRADVFFGDGYGVYFVTPRPGVQVAETTTVITSPDQCLTKELRTTEINLRANLSFCVKTNQGRVSAVAVTYLPASGAVSPSIGIKFTTWE